MHCVLAQIRDTGSHTVEQLQIATGYQRPTVASAISALIEGGFVVKTSAKLYLGGGKGSGAPQAIYTLAEAGS